MKTPFRGDATSSVRNTRDILTSNALAYRHLFRRGVPLRFPLQAHDIHERATSTPRRPFLVNSPSLEVFYHLKKIPIHSEWYFVTIPHHWTAFLASRLQL